MPATLTVTRTTPSSAQLRYEGTSDGAAAYLRKSGATGGDADLTSLAQGPLRSCLHRSDNWSLLGDRIIVRMTIEGPAGVIHPQTFSYTADGNQGEPGALGIIAQWSNNNVAFVSTAGPSTVTFELRFVPSNQR